MAETQKIRVEGVLTAGHEGPAVEVSFDPAVQWGAQPAPLWPGRHGYAVEVLLNGVRFRSAIVSRMSRLFVVVDESIARRAGSTVGQVVMLTVWADGGFEPKGAQCARSKESKPVRQASGPTRHRSPRSSTDLRGKGRGHPTKG
jgi:hypothetical protein